MIIKNRLKDRLKNRIIKNKIKKEKIRKNKKKIRNRIRCSDQQELLHLHLHRLLNLILLRLILMQ